MQQAATIHNHKGKQQNYTPAGSVLPQFFDKSTAPNRFKRRGRVLEQPAEARSQTPAQERKGMRIEA